VSASRHHKPSFQASVRFQQLIITNKLLRLPPPRSVRSVHLCIAYVCLSVCLFVCLSLRSHISKSTCPNFTKFSVPFTYVHGLTVAHCIHASYSSHLNIARMFIAWQLLACCVVVCAMYSDVNLQSVSEVSLYSAIIVKNP